MSDTRDALLDAALDLFVERGVDVPSLREITRAAGQRNTNALQYHFGDREGLLRDLLDRHGELVDQHRDALLDDAPGHGVRPLAAALVEPLVRVLDDATGGPAYLQVAAEVVARPVRFGRVLDLVIARPSLLRWSQLVEPHLPPAAVGKPLHRRFTTIRFAHGELGSRARERGSRADHRLSTSHLVDLVAGLLTTPVSPETAQLIEARATRNR
jgi:AcrR family transcriptional regulator